MDIRSGQVRSGQVRSGQVRSFFISLKNIPQSFTMEVVRIPVQMDRKST